MARTRRPIVPSPAAQALAEAGVTQADVARLAETTSMTVSRVLAGSAPLRPSVLDAIRQLAGPDAAGRVERLVPDREPAHG